MDRPEFGVGSSTFFKKVEEIGMVAMMFAGDVDFFATDHDYLLTVEELLGDYGGEAAEEMATAVDDDGRREHRVWIRSMRGQSRKKGFERR